MTVDERHRLVQPTRHILWLHHLRPRTPNKPNNQKKRKNPHKNSNKT